MDDTERAAWLGRAERLAADGLRVLAVAVHPEAEPEGPVARGLVFLGLVAFRDPPRPRYRRCRRGIAQRRHPRRDGHRGSSEHSAAASPRAVGMTGAPMRR